MTRLTRAGASAGRAAGPSGWPSVTQGLLEALEELVDPDTCGDPQSRLRWTCKSTRELAEALTAQGHPVSDDTVGRLLGQQDYTLQRTHKTEEGAQHPDRDPPFRSVNEQAGEHLAAWQPVISVDTKKKELVGRFANTGREWQPAGWPERVNVHDFPGDAAGKAIPTACTTWAPTPAGSGSGPTTTPLGSRWRPSAAGGSRPAACCSTPPRPGCWCARTPGAATATGSAHGRPSWPGWRPTPALR
jgi:hypothetical protein